MSADCSVDHGVGYLLESVDSTVEPAAHDVVADTTREAGAAEVDSALTGHETYASTLSAARLEAAGSSAHVCVDMAAVRAPPA